ncbi:MAG: ribbon-helix-helix domain-containing protein [Alphaproteobacteria bacterium]
MRDSSRAKRPLPDRNKNGHGCDFISRNIRVCGRRTSIRLERAMWQALEDISARESVAIRDLCSIVDERRRGNNLTAAVRLFIIGYFRIAAMGANPLPPLPTTYTSPPPSPPPPKPKTSFSDNYLGPLVIAAIIALE